VIETNIRALRAIAAVAALGCAVPAWADDAIPNNSFRLGSETVFYHTKADPLAGPYVPAGSNYNLKAENLETLYVGYIRRLPANLAIEVAMGYPPLSKVKGEGSATVGSVPYAGQVISSARWLSPTAFVEYNFLSEDSPLRPFIGVGVNYTQFYARRSTAAGNAASGGPTKLSLTSSVGPAGTVGVDWHVGGHWHMYGSYSISRVNTHLEANTAGIIRTTNIKFGPQVLVISGGYSF